MKYHTQRESSPQIFQLVGRFFRNFKRTCLTALTVTLLFTMFSWSNNRGLLQICPRNSSSCRVTDDDSYYYRMANTLKAWHLVAPNYSAPYNLTSYADYETSVLQVLLVRRLHEEKRNGFFVEAGAFDGEYESNTLSLERDLNWTGLLLEPSPGNYDLLQQRQRKAYISNTCLSSSLCMEQVNLLNAGDRSRAVDIHQDRLNLTRATCFPLYAYLLALDKRTIDYFSLDVQGQELAILKTIPWDKVDIKMLSVETYLIPQGKEALRAYMSSQGYRLHSTMNIGKWWAWDDFYVKKSLVYRT